MQMAALLKIDNPQMKSQDLLLHQNTEHSQETYSKHLSAKLEVKKEKRLHHSSFADQMKSSRLQRAMTLSQEKGASNWLTVL